MPAKKPKLKSSQKYKSFIIVFVGFTGLLFLFVVYYSFSKTVILVSPKQKTVETTVNLAIKENLTAEDEKDDLTLQGLILTKEASGQKTVTLSASEEVPAKATGTVTMYNNWSQPQPLAATTRLLSASGALFRTETMVTVPAKGSVEVNVMADQEGATGNIGPEKFSVPGLSKQMQGLVYGENKAAITGGLRNASVVTAENVLSAQNDLVAELKTQALEDLKTTVKNTDEAFTLDQDSVTYETESKTVTPDIGQETDQFALDLKIKLIGIAFSTAEVNDIALEKLNQELTLDQKITNESFEISYTVEGFDLIDKTASLKVNASGSGQIKLSSAIFNRDNLVNKDRQQITAYFSEFDTIENVEVKFSPFWVFKAPALKDHIEIKFK
ncbi:MAG: hypothetical protein WC528_05200 [Patescibacteria group bacterium]